MNFADKWVIRRYRPTAVLGLSLARKYFKLKK